MFVAENNMTNINQRISPDSGHLIFTKEILGDNCYLPSCQGGHHTRPGSGEERRQLNSGSLSQSRLVRSARPVRKMLG